ncbi:MAG: RloB domain-containing protein [Ignavibacteria bacterium]|nr:RloB domain-containing protein [Ignavibacteria bacterium]
MILIILCCEKRCRKEINTARKEFAVNPAVIRQCGYFLKVQKREVNYFIPFEFISSRIKVVINNDTNNEQQKNRSANKWLLDQYAKKPKTIDKAVGDSVWFVIDVDKKKWIEIDNFHKGFRNEQNTHVIISNPCLEIWLLYHCQDENIPKSSCQALKNTLQEITNGKNHPLDLLPRINDAEQLAKEYDPNPNHFFPNPDSACYSKVYRLIEHIKANSTTEEFNVFLEKTLPKKLAEYRQKNTSKNSGN